MASGAQQCATGPRAAPQPPLLLALLLCLCLCLCVFFLCAVLVAGHGDDDESETEEFHVAFSSSWPTAGRRAVPRPAAARSSSWRPRPRGRWNSAGLHDSKHEVPSGPNPDSNSSAPGPGGRSS